MTVRPKEQAVLYFHLNQNNTQAVVCDMQRTCQQKSLHTPLPFFVVLLNVAGCLIWRSRPEHWPSIWSDGACVAVSPYGEQSLRRCITICCLKTFTQAYFSHRLFFVSVSSTQMHKLLLQSGVNGGTKNQCCDSRNEH